MPPFKNKMEQCFPNGFPNANLKPNSLVQDNLFTFTLNDQIYQGAYLLPSVRFFCPGCGFSPAKYMLYSLVSHCFGKTNRPACPSFMAMNNACLEIKRPRSKGEEERFYIASEQSNWGKHPLELVGGATNDPAYWHRKFKKLIKETRIINMERKNGHFQVNVYQNEDPRKSYSLPKMEVMMRARNPHGLKFLMIDQATKNHPRLPVMIEQVKKYRRDHPDKCQSEEDWGELLITSDDEALGDDDRFDKGANVDNDDGNGCLTMPSVNEPPSKPRAKRKHSAFQHSESSTKRRATNENRWGTEGLTSEDPLAELGSTVTRLVSKVTALESELSAVRATLEEAKDQLLDTTQELHETKDRLGNLERRVE